MLSIFRQSESEIVDLRQRNYADHPLAFRYSEVFKAALITGHLSDGRIQPGVSISAHPFTIAASAMLDKYYNDSWSGIQPEEVLVRFYEHFQPASAKEWFGVVRSQSTLESWKAFQAVPPWRARTHLDYGEQILLSAVREAAERQIGDIELQDPALLWGKCGPVLPLIIRAEADRIQDLVTSMTKLGYRRDDSKYGDVKAVALVRRDGSWKWVVTSGYHRACVAYAMGYESIPIRVALVVQEDHVKFWPHVLSKSFSSRDASEIFDRVFEGVHSAF